MPQDKDIKVLFICKKRVDTYGVSFGLLNSANFVVNTLKEFGIDAKLVAVNDNNCIDKEVTTYKPTHVMVEALWVVPEKFRVLRKIHPNVKWYVRIHSKMPFLANEGIAITWIKEYHKIYKEIGAPILAPNSLSLYNDLKKALNIKNEYLPNIYNPKQEKGFLDFLGVKTEKENLQEIDIGCFGAIRPFKNHLNQAVGAIIYANKIGKKLKFHINGNRIEQKGEEVYKNLKALFKDESKHELVEHSWMPHDEFVEVVKSMDIGMQVSFSESFNIVAADFALNNIPVIGSPDIDWMPRRFCANPNDTSDIAKKLELVVDHGFFGWFPPYKEIREALQEYNDNSTCVWLKHLRNG